MTTVYKLKRRRPRVTRRAALAVGVAAFAGFVTLGAATEHMPAPRQPAAVAVSAPVPAGSDAPSAASPAAKAAGTHPVLASAGRLALRGLVPHPYLRHRSYGWRLWRRATR